MLKRSPSSTTGTRHLQSSCTAPQNTFGEAPADSTPLEHNSQCYHLLPLYLPIIPGYPWVFWGKVFLPSLHCQTGWGDPCTMYLLLSGWQAQGCSLPVSQTFDLGIITMPVCRADKRVKFPPPLWESVISLQVSLDPLDWVVGGQHQCLPITSFLSRKGKFGAQWR